MLTMAKRRRKPPAGNPWPARLKALRDKYGLTQRSAAERIGVAQRTVISWENNQSTPSRLALNLLKDAFPDDFGS